jgi:cation diffusion facilitator CzcD-associated flavoprotein CzcO
MSVQIDQDTATRAGSGTGPRHVRVAIVGTGFSGLGMAIKLKQRGMDDFVVLERAQDIGGTWRDNSYPGCACDVPSHLYSFSFALNPDWTQSYSPWNEIRDYLRGCAERFGVLPHIRFGHEVLDATWDERDLCWHIATSQGQFTADLFVLGNGPLSEPSTPSIPGLDRFEGQIFHSSRWDHDHDLTGERVAVIGTGASSIQIVPSIQPYVRKLYVYQRTPPWIVPRLNHEIPEQRRALFRRLPIFQRLARASIYLQHELVVLGFVYQPQMIKGFERVALHHLERLVSDPDLRGNLTPSYTMGCKRVLVSDDFYPALMQGNVELITERIREVRSETIATETGVEREVDTLILATGFHVTDMPAAGFVHGRDGRSLTDAWREGPQAYLGMTVAGFPNLFLLIGPNTGVGHTSMVYMIESELAYVLDCLRLMERRGIQAVELRPEAQDAYNREVQRRMQGTVWVSGCASWYLDAHGHNTTLWPGFTFEYRWRTRRFDPANYQFMVSRVGVRSA